MHLSVKQSRFVVLAFVALAACEDEPTIPNREPMAGQIPLQTVHVGERRSLDLSGYFTDPDGDALTFTAESGHPDLVSVSVLGSTLELVGLRQGAATVTVTATDPDGLAASSHMDVVIPNRAPVVSGTPADQRLPGPGRTVEVDVAGVFSDPDGDALTFEAESGDTSVVAVAVSGFVVTLTGGGTGGAAQATVTATDPDGLAASTSFGVTVNRVPVWRVEIPAQTVTTQTPGLELDLAPYAIDPDGDALTFEAESGDPAVVAVAVSGSVVTLTGGGTGGATRVTVTATDPDGLSASTGFAVAVVENPDRAALVALYDATDGPNWQHNDNWLTDAPLGEWYGVRVNAEGRVISLALDSNALTGAIPPELGNLSALEYLRLSYNALTGPIPPELGNLSALERLYLRQNAHTGPIPPELGNLTALAKLDLFNNLLTGPIPPGAGQPVRAVHAGPSATTCCSVRSPPELGNLAALYTLELNGNVNPGSGLTGPVPPELGNLSELEVLDLRFNDLTGPIPPELGNLSALERLWLNDNGLTGPIPPELGNLAALESLGLSDNALTGPIPPELRDLAALKWLAISGTGLCLPGTVDFWRWASEHLTDFVGAFCTEADRVVLEALYGATGGRGWTRSDSWLAEGPVLAEWHGITTDSLGRVASLTLPGNNLVGRLPAAPWEFLEGLKVFDVANNPRLEGPLPLLLGRVSLDTLRFSGTGLCSFQESREWLESIPVVEGTGETCAPLSDRDILVALYNATDGPNWQINDNWLTDAPLGEWYGVRVNAEGRVVRLDLRFNALTGAIPPELGNLATLEWLVLPHNALTGPIPPELGNLSELEELALHANALTGAIPPELGNLAALEGLYLASNDLTGSIPPELGNLGALKILWLASNDLTGPIPPELGNLSELESLWLNDNRLTGPIPPELGNLAALESLYLDGNALTGPIPPELRDLAALKWLYLGGNESLLGALPMALTALQRLQYLLANNTGLCAPTDPDFQRWARALRVYRLRQCSTVAAYLVQSAQSRNHPVPLVAGREALLRVFPTVAPGSEAPVPMVRATFHVGGEEMYSVEIPGKPGPLPAEIDEGDLRISANVRIPGDVVRPGLEMVVEIDPDNTLDPSLGVARRIPAEGRAPLGVDALPIMELTVVPFLWTEDPDSSIVSTVEDWAADPESHELMRLPGALLPAHDWTVTAHTPVWTDIRPDFSNGIAILNLTGAIRASEGGRRYWMGALVGGGGWAGSPGWTSVSGLGSATITHELGHNMNLAHAPCGGPLGIDPAFPYPTGRISVWGYDFANGRLVGPGKPDVMSYCGPAWISDYHFGRAFRHRLQAEGSGQARSVAGAPVRSLLLWGGVDSTGVPYLEPAVVVDAPPSLPEGGGPWTIAGRSADGTELFSLPFDMPEIADAGEGAGGFTFVLPAGPGWEALASVTLSGPGGTATLDADTDRPLSIWRDGDGQVRAILRRAPALAPDGTPSAPPGLSGLSLTFSRGIPSLDAWRR